MWIIIQSPYSGYTSVLPSCQQFQGLASAQESCAGTSPCPLKTDIPVDNR